MAAPTQRLAVRRLEEPQAAEAAKPSQPGQPEEPRTQEADSRSQALPTQASARETLERQGPQDAQPLPERSGPHSQVPHR